jgi:hypothetical protein
MNATGEMRATARLHELGQSIWLDNITREMLDPGQLQSYIDEQSATLGAAGATEESR